MRNFLQSQISEETFNACWETTAPPFQGFLDATAARLSEKANEEEIAQFSAAIQPDGRNRVRIDGEFKTRTGNTQSYYIEIVRLPSSNSYRSKASFRDTLPEIEPKSVDQFIAALDAIVEEKTMILSGQAFQAVLGVDSKAKELPRAFPAIFRLFERFPDEYFDSPETLMSLMVEVGGYEEELIKSLQRVPSLPGVALVSHLLQSAPSAGERQQWISLLQDVSESSPAHASVKKMAREFTP